jgi:hypothetical protein
MGLLDEAIREHLELKRRRGADLGAVAREEREALAPVFPEASATSHGQPNGEPNEAPANSAGGDAGSALAEPAPNTSPRPGDGLPTGGPALAEETAELDMLEVIEQDSNASGEHTDTTPDDVPGRERLSFE